MSVKYKSSDGWKDISSSSNNAVDTVADGNMNPVTSNAVYDAMNTVTTGTAVDDSDCYIGYVKIGKVIIFNIHAHAAYSGFKTIPFTCVKVGEGQKCGLFWSGSALGESYLRTATEIYVDCTAESSGELVCVLQ